MCMRSRNRDIKKFARHHIASGTATADVRGSTGGQSTIDALCPSQAKFQNWGSLRSQIDPCGLSRNQGLEIKNIQQGGFQKLTLNQTPPHLHHGRIGKHHRPLFDGINVTGKPKILQVIQKFGGKHGCAILLIHLPQVVQLPLLKL